MKRIKVELEITGKDNNPTLYMERSAGRAFPGKRHVLTMTLTPQQAAQMRVFLEH
jgi:hypothetical protein